MDLVLPPRVAPRSTALVQIRPWPDLIYVSQGRMALATGRDGFLHEEPYQGLFFHETRLLSRWRYRIRGSQGRDEQPWTPVALSNVEQHEWLGYYITLPPGVGARESDKGSGHLSQSSEQSLELRLSRSVGQGMHEDVDLTNFSGQTTRFVLEIEVDADFADLVETFQGEERRQRGTTQRTWKEGGGTWELAFDYLAEHRPGAPAPSGGKRELVRIERGMTLRVERASSPPVWEDRTLRFHVELEPRASWHCCFLFIPRFRDAVREEPPPRKCVSFEANRRPFHHDAVRFSTVESETLGPVVTGALRQAICDLDSLRLDDFDDHDGQDHAWTMAAGLPLYLALFGRDTLTTAWQAASLGPEMMLGTLRSLAQYQGRETDDWRDEQPGRMLHEAHTGPIPTLGFDPRGRYYGSITTSGFYPFVVSELWHWTGDRERVQPFLRPALDALHWLDTCCDHIDLDGRDGFIAYQTRSSQGVKHQGWKDSGSAIVDDQGRQVEPPIATCEEQAFVYAAKLHLSEVLWWLDEKDEARRLFHEAGELKKRFNEAFWMEDEGFFAMGLDAEGRPIRAVGSNPGHCLAAGIVDDALVKRTAARLLAEDLWSGWGVRTLSTENPAFNPYSYHRGSVWPVEHGSFVFGFLRYGLHGELEQICRGMFEAARIFEHFRLPEVFSGHARDAAHPFPAIYPQANSPQAWSASAVVSLVQALLGLYPYAPLKMLLLDPQLPEWLPELTLSNLRVGGATVDLRFRRSPDGRSDWELLDQRGKLHILRQPSPWSLTASFGERLHDTLASLLPGR